MSGRYEARRHDDIPPLAWLLDFSPRLNRPALHHGRHVELFDTGFFEGAWDGAFAQGGFEESANVFGSGAKIDSSTITFVPPSHTNESLVLFIGEGSSACSNSLAFLSAYCGFDLEPIDWHSGERFAAITQGLNHAVQSCRLRAGLLTIRYYYNFVIANSIVDRQIAKPLPPKFEDFDSYCGYLVKTARKVCDNAGHEARVRRYVPLTTLSAGYDSSAGSVIASVLGCRDAVALSRSQRGIPDSGVAVAQTLGLRLRELERVTHLSQPSITVAEFLAPGAQGEDYIYHAFEDLVPGKVLFTGLGGGVAWGKSMPPTEVMYRDDLSGSSLGEFRLSRDFVHLPVPYIGYARHPDIYRITHSAEMAPYSIGGNYDRPIPRRIVESAGVPRTAFGHRKLATSLIFYRKAELISKNGHSEIAAFENGLGLSWIEKLYVVVLRVRWQIGLALFHGFRRMTMLRGRRIPAAKALRPIGRAGIAALSRILGPYEVFEHGDPQNAIWHRWAVSRIKFRYASVVSPHVAPTRRAAADPHRDQVDMPLRKASLANRTLGASNALNEAS